MTCGDRGTNPSTLGWGVGAREVSLRAHSVREAQVTSVQLLHRNVQRFRGGLVFKAHRLCVSLNDRLESNKEEEGWGGADAGSIPASSLCPRGTGYLRATVLLCKVTSKASLRRTGVRSTCGPICPYSGRDYVKSLRSSYAGLYPKYKCSLPSRRRRMTLPSHDPRMASPKASLSSHVSRGPLFLFFITLEPRVE